MKRYIAIVFMAIVAMIAPNELSAQHHFGVVGGFSFTNSNDNDVNVGIQTRFNAGLTYQLKLPLGFSIQPSLVYHSKAANLKTVEGENNTVRTNCGYIELPVSVQWGPDLVLFRPFLDVTPFVGYGVYTNIKSAEGVIKKWSQTGMNRWEYGLGLGVGIEIWRFQIIGRYNWNFGDLMKNAPDTSVGQILQTAWKNRNYGGVTLNISFMF